MLRQSIQRSIIATIQLTGLAVLALVLAMTMLHHTDHLNHWHDFFVHFHRLFFMVHVVFYIALFKLWPHAICLMAHRQQTIPSSKQIKAATNARFYLLGIFLLIELLNGLR
jgi:hypothetical protein